MSSYLTQRGHQRRLYLIGIPRLLQDDDRGTLTLVWVNETRSVKWCPKPVAGRVCADDACTTAIRRKMLYCPACASARGMELSRKVRHRRVTHNRRPQGDPL